IWGASFPLAKIVLRDVGPLTYLVLRHVVGGGLLLAIAASIGAGRVQRDDLWAFARLGVILVGFHQGVQAFGLARTTATNSGWLIAASPLFIALLARLVLGERLRRRQWIGMACGLLGSFAVVTQGKLGGAALLSSGGLGDLMVLESAAAWAAFSVAGKGLLARYPPIAIAAYGMAAGMAIALPIWLAGGGAADLLRLGGPGWAAMTFLGVCGTALAYVLWYRAMQTRAAGVVGAYMFLQPLEATFLGRLMLGEALTAATIAGGLMILGGVYLAAWPSQATARRRGDPEGAT
ncbi:MAG TPA: EamA family transporter, partial [Candidatus Methylomirabilis sp.]